MFFWGGELWVIYMARIAREPLGCTFAAVGWGGGMLLPGWMGFNLCCAWLGWGGCFCPGGWVSTFAALGWGVGDAFARGFGFWKGITA